MCPGRLPLLTSSPRPDTNPSGTNEEASIADLYHQMTESPKAGLQTHRLQFASSLPHKRLCVAGPLHQRGARDGWQEAEHSCTLMTNGLCKTDALNLLSALSHRFKDRVLDNYGKLSYSRWSKINRVHPCTELELDAAVLHPLNEPRAASCAWRQDPPSIRKMFTI